MTTATEALHEAGQSIWLDNITRSLLESGRLEELIDGYSVTGLTSNPAILQKAITSGDYDEAIRELVSQGKRGEELVFELAIEDLGRAADLFAPIHGATGGVDGWVSLEVSPFLAEDPDGTVKAAQDLWSQAGRENLFIKIPGVPAGLPAIEACIYRGIPVNVTLLFDDRHYLAAAGAFMRGLERRHEEDLPPVVASVASVFMSRWDAAVNPTVASELHDAAALAIGKRAYKTYRQVLGSDRWQRLANAGARAQRLLWASTSTKEEHDDADFYVHSLGAPFTVDTMPEGTLVAFGDGGHGHGIEPLPADGGDSDAMLSRIAEAGVDVTAVANDLQRKAAEAFVSSWQALLDTIDDRAKA